MSRPGDWDAATYDRVADPQEEWGLEVLSRLDLEGDETALDAGCGSGRVTRHLLDRLPRGSVIGVDAAPSMIEVARGALAEYGDRVRPLLPCARRAFVRLTRWVEDDRRPPRSATLAKPCSGDTVNRCSLD